MHRILSKAGRFAISVLAEHQQILSTHFAGRPQENFETPFVSRVEMPVIDGSVAHFIARVVDVHAAGDHTLYIGQVEHFEFCEDRPLLFHAGKYGRIQ